LLGAAGIVDTGTAFIDLCKVFVVNVDTGQRLVRITQHDAKAEALVMTLTELLRDWKPGWEESVTPSLEVRRSGETRQVDGVDHERHALEGPGLSTIIIIRPRRRPVSAFSIFVFLDGRKPAAIQAYASCPRRGIGWGVSGPAD
jgi:hypothetical protein